MKKTIAIVSAILCVACTQEVEVSFDHPVKIEVEPGRPLFSLEVLWVDAAASPVEQTEFDAMVAEGDPDLLLAILPSGINADAAAAGMETVAATSGDGTVYLAASKLSFDESAVIPSGASLPEPAVDVRFGDLWFTVGAVSSEASAAELLERTARASVSDYRIFALGSGISAEALSYLSLEPLAEMPGGLFATPGAWPLVSFKEGTSGFIVKMEE